MRPMTCASRKTRLLRLLVLLWTVVLPTYAAFGRAPPTSHNSPFHALETLDPRMQVPEDPVCCLVPLPPIPPERPPAGQQAPVPSVDHEEPQLLSFEDWKEKMSALEAKAKARKEGNVERNASDETHHSDGDKVTTTRENETAADLTVPNDDHNGLADDAQNRQQGLSPHFRIPTTDRFNYASTDCSARVHGSHKSAKSPSAILSSKKDRYMLSPCSKNKEKQFVVVELCDDIRIDTVQLANFEFFSGVFKEFQVSVSKTLLPDLSDWIDVGTYRAKNVRGVQTFHPPQTLRDFYRYIRIDFLSHYSAEYYCPVSLLRVYGLTHLEQWKWEKWEEEAKEKQALLQQASRAPNSDTLPSSEAISETFASYESLKAQIQHNTSSTISGLQVESGQTLSVTESNATTAVSSARPAETASSTSAKHLDPGMQHVGNVQTGPEIATTTTEHMPVVTGLSDHSAHFETSLPSSFASTTTLYTTQTSSPPAEDKLQSTSTTKTEQPSSSPADSASEPGASTSTSTTTITASSTAATTYHGAPAGSSSGESIYRIIMNRLASVESNQTLYKMYFEDQMNGVREVLRVMKEEAGRLESLTKAQNAMFSRSVTEWERSRAKLERDYSELLARVDKLGDEIVLEKRLGIAQLCLLLTVLVFLGLTRGSRGDQPLFIHHPWGLVSGRGLGSGNSVGARLNEFGRSLSFGGLRRRWQSKSDDLGSKIPTGSPRKVPEEQNNRSRPKTARLSSAVDVLDDQPSRRAMLPRHLWDDIGTVEFPAIASASSAATPRQPKLVSQRVPHSAPRPYYHTPNSSSATQQQHSVFHSQSRPTRALIRPRSRTPSLKKRRDGTPTTGRREHPGTGPLTPTPSMSKRPRTPSASSRRHDLSPPPSRAKTHVQTISRPLLVRASSSTLDDWTGTGGGQPRSARKFARSAHLHEVPTSATKGKGKTRSLSMFTDSEDEGAPSLASFRAHRTNVAIEDVDSSPLARRRKQSSIALKGDETPSDLTQFLNHPGDDVLGASTPVSPSTASEAATEDSDMWVTDTDIADSALATEDESEIDPDEEQTLRFGREPGAVETLSDPPSPMRPSPALVGLNLSTTRIEA